MQIAPGSCPVKGTGVFPALGPAVKACAISGPEPEQGRGASARRRPDCHLLRSQKRLHPVNAQLNHVVTRKNALLVKFFQKRGCESGGVAVNTPSPAALRRFWRGGSGFGLDLPARLLRHFSGGRAVRIGRTRLIVVSCSLTLLVSEEICGRFGSFRWISVCISRS